MLITEHEGVPTVAVSGEVDLHAVPSFRSAVEDAEAKAGPERLVLVDLGGVSFMDSSGLGVLIAHHRELKEDGGELRVIAGEAALKILRLTSLDEVFGIYESRGEAVGHGGGTS